MTDSRYILLASFPFTEACEGHIYEWKRDGDVCGFEIEPTVFVQEDFMARYPKIFKPLRWFEHRDIEDMPRYLKDARTDSDSPYHIVHKVMDYYQNRGIVIFENGDDDNINRFLPATEEEYLAYKNTTSA